VLVEPSVALRICSEADPPDRPLLCPEAMAVGFGMVASLLNEPTNDRGGAHCFARKRRRSRASIVGS
jgi:hypothetical protein